MRVHSRKCVWVCGVWCARACGGGGGGGGKAVPPAGRGGRRRRWPPGSSERSKSRSPSRSTCAPPTHSTALMQLPSRWLGWSSTGWRGAGEKRRATGEPGRRGTGTGAGARAGSARRRGGKGRSHPAVDEHVEGPDDLLHRSHCVPSVPSVPSVVRTHQQIVGMYLQAAVQEQLCTLKFRDFCQLTCVDRVAEHAVDILQPETLRPGRNKRGSDGPPRHTHGA